MMQYLLRDQNNALHKGSTQILVNIKIIIVLRVLQKYI